MSLPHLIDQYGYLAVFLGCLAEGETVLMLAGFAAHRGYLSFPIVVALAFCAGTLGDQLIYFLGYRYGRALLARWPRLAARVQSAIPRIERYQTGMIIGVRFMYGLRLAGPFAIGLSKVSPWRFSALNMVGAALWAVLIASMGYLFGRTLEWLIADLRRYEELAFVLILAILVPINLLRHLRHRHS